MDRIILHADVNNFYASVAMCVNPELKGKALIVCGDPEKRHGIVLAKSNLAKQYGIKTGDTLNEAKRKAPDLIVVPPDYKQYMKYSNLIYNIYVQYTPYVESFGLDECWLDVTGCEKQYGSGENLANVIRERIKNELGLTVSIGVSFTKVFAKLGSDLKKPDAVTVISRDNYKGMIWPLKVDEMLFIGKSMKQQLARIDVETIGELATLPIDSCINMFGKVGEKLHAAANGIENDPVKPYNYNELPESVSNGSTTEKDICDTHSAAVLIYSLSEIIAFRLRQYGLIAGGVSLTVRDNKLSAFTRQEKLITYTASAQEIAETALNILKRNYSFTEKPPLRMITVGTYKLIRKDEYAQASLFDDENTKNTKIDERIDKLRTRYGYDIVKRGIVLNDSYACDAKEVTDGYLPFDKTKNVTDDNNK